MQNKNIIDNNDNHNNHNKHENPNSERQKKKVYKVDPSLILRQLDDALVVSNSDGGNGDGCPSELSVPSSKPNPSLSPYSPYTSSPSLPSFF